MVSLIILEVVVLLIVVSLLPILLRVLDVFFMELRAMTRLKRWFRAFSAGRKILAFFSHMTSYETSMAK